MLETKVKDTEILGDAITFAKESNKYISKKWTITSYILHLLETASIFAKGEPCLYKL